MKPAAVYEYKTFASMLALGRKLRANVTVSLFEDTESTIDDLCDVEAFPEDAAAIMRGDIVAYIVEVKVTRGHLEGRDVMGGALFKPGQLTELYDFVAEYEMIDKAVDELQTRITETLTDLDIKAGK